jgi:hypothetical protein
MDETPNRHMVLDQHLKSSPSGLAAIPQQYCRDRARILPDGQLTSQADGYESL